MVLVATHDLDLIDGIVDRAVVLRRGRVGTLAETGGTLRERYRAALAE